jgi:hypothetical protein
MFALTGRIGLFKWKTSGSLSKYPLPGDPVPLIVIVVQDALWMGKKRSYTTD